MSRYPFAPGVIVAHKKARPVSAVCVFLAAVTVGGLVGSGVVLAARAVCALLG